MHYTITITITITQNKEVKSQRGVQWSFKIEIKTIKMLNIRIKKGGGNYNYKSHSVF